MVSVTKCTPRKRLLPGIAPGTSDSVNRGLTALCVFVALDVKARQSVSNLSKTKTFKRSICNPDRLILLLSKGCILLFLLCLKSLTKNMDFCLSLMRGIPINTMPGGGQARRSGQVLLNALFYFWVVGR